MKEIDDAQNTCQKVQLCTMYCTSKLSGMVRKVTGYPCTSRCCGRKTPCDKYQGANGVFYVFELFKNV